MLTGFNFGLGEKCRCMHTHTYVAFHYNLAKNHTLKYETIKFLGGS